MQWIVAVRAVEADFEVITLPAMLFQDLPDLVAEVALYFEYELDR